VVFAARVLRAPAQAAGHPVHRTAFTRGAADGSLLFNPFDFTLKNVANTGVLNWGGRLLALYEVRSERLRVLAFVAV
jgi:all-trans-8'-apo-beta-carotenal 15,15'-oxygenase